MYIRSQNKEELAEFSRLSVACLNGSYYISTPGVNPYHSIGDYGSKERCIAVLDELQIAIDRGLSTFNMPKE